KDKNRNYFEQTGQVNSEGERLSTNPESSGRCHTDWLNMMYTRLVLSKKLLTDGGVIFISIDDHELTQLKMIADQIYGEQNLLGIISTVNNLKGRSDEEFFATSNEFLLCYTKDRKNAVINGLEPGDEYKNEFKYSDSISNYKEVGLKKTGKNS